MQKLKRNVAMESILRIQKIIMSNVRDDQLCDQLEEKHLITSFNCPISCEALAARHSDYSEYKQAMVSVTNDSLVNGNSSSDFVNYNWFETEYDQRCARIQQEMCNSCNFQDIQGYCYSPLHAQKIIIVVMPVNQDAIDKQEHKSSQYGDVIRIHAFKQCSYLKSLKTVNEISLISEDSLNVFKQQPAVDGMFLIDDSCNKHLQFLSQNVRSVFVTVPIVSSAELLFQTLYRGLLHKTVIVPLFFPIESLSFFKYRWIGNRHHLAYILARYMFSRCNIVIHKRDKLCIKQTEIRIVSLSNKPKEPEIKKCVFKPKLRCRVVAENTIDLNISKTASEEKDDLKSNLRQNTSLPDTQSSNFSQSVTVAPIRRENRNSECLQRSSENLDNSNEVLQHSHESSQQSSEIISPASNSLQTDHGMSDAEGRQLFVQNQLDNIAQKPRDLFKEERVTETREENSNELKHSCDAVDCLPWKSSESDPHRTKQALQVSEKLRPPDEYLQDEACGGASAEIIRCIEESCPPGHDEFSKDHSILNEQESLDGRNESQAPSQPLNQEPSQERQEFPTPAVDDSDIQRFEPMMAIIDKIAIGERVPPQITMRYEMLRFCTLRSFPKENKPFITRIAQAGFYYANTRDEVVCYCCAKRKSDWQETDVPLEVHRQLNPNCRFLNHNSEVNVSVKKQEQLAQRRSLSAPGLSSSASNPLIAATAAAQTSEASRQRNIGQSNQFSASTNTHHSTALSRTQTSTTLSQPTTTLSASQGSSQSRPLIAVDRPHGNFSALSVASVLSPTYSQSVGINSMTSTLTTTTTTTTVSSTSSQAATVRPPKYPAYATQAQRDASFRDCSELVVPAQSLAEAGFFYAGFGDCCRCFQCGVGLRHWSAEDDPWIEHSRWSRNCAFVKEKKGEEFVNLVQMAVEYQQNQQNQQQQQQQSTTETGAVAGSGNDLEHLLHTDAAQSVLEMGYSSAVIQRAIRECINTNGNTELTAAMLMEKIFAFDESTASPVVPPNIRMPETSTTVPNTAGESSKSHRNGEIAKRDFARNTASDEGAVASNSASQQGNNGIQTSRQSQLREQKKLKEENERLKQQSICTQCKQNGVSIVFLPCGHLVTCEQCAEKVRYCTERNCGKYIKGTVRTYVA